MDLLCSAFMAAINLYWRDVIQELFNLSLTCDRNVNNGREVASATVDTCTDAACCLPSHGRNVLNSNQYACLAVAVQSAQTQVLERLLSRHIVALRLLYM